MAKAKYNQAEHKRRVTEYAKLITEGRAFCVEPVCLMAIRHIPPSTPRKDWHVPHNEDGVTYRDGPAHARCNITEGLRRRHSSASRWVL